MNIIHGQFSLNLSQYENTFLRYIPVNSAILRFNPLRLLEL